MLGPVAAPAATLRVPADHPSITAAVAAARPGDEIVVAAGLYSPARTREAFPLRLSGKSLTIRGVGSGRTRLDAQGASRLFVFSGGDVSTLEDLRLAGGRTPTGGGAILVEEAGPVLRRVRFEANESAVDGDAILVRGGRARVENCVFSSNGGRGATVCVTGGAPEIVRSTWWGNGGPALEIRAGAQARVERCVIARPGVAGGARLGLRILASAVSAAPVLAGNLFLECDDGVIRVEGEAGALLAAGLEEARRARGLRSGTASLRDPIRDDFRVAGGPLGDEDVGAYGGEAALPAPLPRSLADSSRATAAASDPLLGPSVPNPFTPSTTIQFHVPVPDVVDLGIYNVLGQRVRTLPAGDLAAGGHRRDWDGRDDRGEDLPPGIYFVRITIGGVTESQRLVLLR
jgi:hypothetical protein